MSQRITRFQIPLEELTITPGSACQGCGAALAARLAFKALGPNVIRHGVPCCPDSVTRHPRAGSVFEGGGAMLTGTWRGLKALGRTDVQAVGFFGDGGTYDIGLQGLSAAAERNENIWVITKDNEAYMNTGNQRSSSTPLYARTSTTPVGTLVKGKQTGKKNVPMIFAAHGAPYVATASVGYPEDLIAKIEYGKTVYGFKMLIIHSPCPVGWRFDPSKTIEVARLAVQSGFWPLYEIIDGERFRLTYRPRELRPVSEYLGPQARFRHVTDEQMAGIQEETARRWEKLIKSDETEQIIL
ncbi:MAG: thiamine pyrophosphate-dependent enzyme [Candidatus Bathyarchaeota archaeon]|nr:thiamine pyrophosphate-dependent enzyme [Candidatus Bathyarchaeota archaeon]